MLSYIQIHQCFDEMCLDEIGEWLTVKDALELANRESKGELAHPDIFLVFFNEQGQPVQPVWSESSQSYTHFMRTGE